ncbi:MAG: hypothetical protein AABY32_02275 [Nanoarchaeota archaeon]
MKTNDRFIKIFSSLADNLIKESMDSNKKCNRDFVFPPIGKDKRGHYPLGPSPLCGKKARERASKCKTITDWMKTRGLTCEKLKKLVNQKAMSSGKKKNIFAPQKQVPNIPPKPV